MVQGGLARALDRLSSHGQPMASDGAYRCGIFVVIGIGGRSATRGWNFLLAYPRAVPAGGHDVPVRAPIGPRAARPVVLVPERLVRVRLVRVRRGGRDVRVPAPTGRPAAVV